MKQKKYIVYAVLILLVCFAAYFAITKISKTKAVENPPTGTINYEKPTDSLSGSPLEGKILYLNKCGSCHGSFDRLDGPWLSLAGVNSQWPDKKELFAFIRNPEEVIKKMIMQES